VIGEHKYVSFNVWKWRKKIHVFLAYTDKDVSKIGEEHVFSQKKGHQVSVVNQSIVMNYEPHPPCKSFPIASESLTKKKKFDKKNVGIWHTFRYVFFLNNQHDCSFVNIKPHDLESNSE